MRVINPSIQAALDAGVIVKRGLVLFSLGSGEYGWWQGFGPFIYNGITYNGAGSILAIEPVGQATDNSAIPVRVSFSGIPSEEISPDIIAQIESEAYKGRLARIYVAAFDPDTNAFIDVIAAGAFTIDVIEHQYQVDSSYTVTAILESRALDHFKTGHRVRSDEDQRKIDPDDRALRYVSIVAKQVIDWGPQPREGRRQ